MELRSYGIYACICSSLSGCNQLADSLTKLWDFLEGKTLFEAVDPHKEADYDDEKRLAYITALLGPAPQVLLDGGSRASLFYDSDGKRSPCAWLKKTTAAQATARDFEKQTLYRRSLPLKARSLALAEKRRKCFWTSCAACSSGSPRNEVRRKSYSVTRGFTKTFRKPRTCSCGRGSLWNHRFPGRGEAARRL